MRRPVLQRVFTLVVNDQCKMDMFEDLQSFDTAFRTWAKVPVEWEPKVLTEDKAS